MEELRAVGLLLRRHLLPAVRCLDLGRRLARPARQQRSSSASATSTSPAPAWCTPWAARRRWPVRSCSAPASASSARTASPARMPGHHIPMAMLGTFILLFGWFGFNAASTFAATDVQFAIVAANTAIAGSLRCGRVHALRDVDDGQARPRHDGQRHARRPGGDHRSVCLRRPLGGGGHRHRSPACSWSWSINFIEQQVEDRRPGRRHLGARRERHVRRARRRHLRQRQVRRRMEPHAPRARPGALLASPASSRTSVWASASSVPRPSASS